MMFYVLSISTSIKQRQALSPTKNHAISLFGEAIASLQVEQLNSRVLSLEHAHLMYFSLFSNMKVTIFVLPLHIPQFE